MQPSNNEDQYYEGSRCSTILLRNWVVNNNMSNNVEGEILEDHFDGDRGNDTIEDNADVNPSTNVSLEVNIPEVANDSSIVSPSTPPGNDLNIAKESCSTWLDMLVL
ncbi:hypothetical protein Tco_1298784 [Tanacetum coccineum]|uniref:Uncharacterized protein n=1 Tax=Tanacetum coccineum TaxID=301880 RepID=A0ABQ5HJV8_9ASTR